ncbi:bifunctional acetate--CoA ligase family protein/GNAT family N-acetyltransferase [Noviherbaspirillum sp. CPCC 100848]|uniref:Bifunctional acetate--CoA ligase family protein/GNAT family N-acetyltransferase n=1 Tax=Noviherbaspirillum album TaxID=3080276 RepID=A0ABU6J739_9BURK|nr:bifunctional acetate--CoA ligase family protein/GNAT family N-acetyltransferase [Noviherbaspirillum sp. CPCC 100848]MEC4719009.1 bifunctional acetate--CoA ligase family protein/GNAT family N-acetyltransferase [Noviherbaspirillum sp. CPCC 100848]
MEKHYLSPLFTPGAIVVFAGEDGTPGSQTSHGKLIKAQLQAAAFDGRVTYLDVGMSGTLGDLAQSQSDLAIIALPNEQLAAALEVAARIRSKTALIVSGGVDAALAQRLQSIARQHGIHLLGPNSMGFQRPQLNLNASALGPLARTGSLALVSQSGALSSSILDWAVKNGVGFSTVVSLGAHTSLDVAEVLDFLAQDRRTQSVVVYLEGICNARRFMSALRAAANVKPVFVLKAGRKPAGSSAALTHSGAIVGSDDVFDAALQRAGAVRVRSFVQLFTAAKGLSARNLPVGKRLAVISNGGGPGVLAADWTNELGLELGMLVDAEAAALAPQLSPLANLQSVIDLGEEAAAQHYHAAVSACAGGKGIDGILVILSPKPDLDTTAVAQALADLYPSLAKPLVTCWMGDERAADARTILSRAAIPTYRTPEAAVDAFSNIASFHQNQQLLQQTPPPLSPLPKPDLEGARILVESVLAERRKVLTEMESKALLAAFHIPVTKTILARSASEAILIANQLGYPVALKIDSPDIPHKSDVQGVALNLQNAAAVRDTWNDMMATVKRLRPDAHINGVTIQNMSGKPRGRELYIGVNTDEPFGPVISFGAGGTMIELIADRAIELPPLNQFLAQRLIDRARSAETLDNWRGAPPADRESLEQMLLRVSEMVCALPQLKAMDINPVIVDAAGALAVDARVVVGHAPRGAGDYPHLAILPYPSDREEEWPLRGGGHYIMRPVHPNDAEMLQDFVRRLSPESRYMRFVSTMRELSLRMLARFTLIDYDREMALVAVHRERTPDEQGGFRHTDRIIAVSRYVTNPDLASCEFSLAVADEFSGQGIGSRMMLAIMDVARSKGLERVEGLVLSNNVPMLKLMRSLGFEVRRYEEDMDFRLCVRTL